MNLKSPNYYINATINLNKLIVIKDYYTYHSSGVNTIKSGSTLNYYETNFDGLKVNMVLTDDNFYTFELNEFDEYFVDLEEWREKQIDLLITNTDINE